MKIESSSVHLLVLLGGFGTQASPEEPSLSVAVAGSTWLPGGGGRGSVKKFYETGRTDNFSIFHTSHPHYKSQVVP